jgi:hypothetical protein
MTWRGGLLHVVLAFAVFPAAFAASADAQPRTLSAAFSAVIKLEGGVLLYSSGRRTEKLSPTPQQWRAFRRAVDEAGVWSWQPSYERLATDGYGWTLHIEYPDRKIDSRGYAAIPDIKSYRRCLYALQTLVGGRPIHGRRMNALEVFDAAELRLVATHPAKNRREQWADLRDPRGRIHRLTYDANAPRGDGYLARVTDDSVTLSELVVDAEGDLVYRTVVVQKVGAR